MINRRLLGSKVSALQSSLAFAFVVLAFAVNSAAAVVDVSFEDTPSGPSTFERVGGFFSKALDKLKSSSKKSTGAQSESQIASAEDIKPQAKVMKAMIQKYCLGCHTQTNANTGDADVVLARFGDFTKAGILRKYVAPGGVGSAEQSNLYGRVESGNMPMFTTLKANEKAEFLAAVKDWIDAGAPDLEVIRARPFVAKETALSLIERDILRFSEKEAPFIRYISLLNVFNNNETQGDTLNLVAAVSKFLNSTSWNPNIIKPITLDAKTHVILRIDIRQYGWTSQDWKMIESAYPYANDYNDVRVDGRDLMRNLRRSTQTGVPMVRADWLVSTMSLPPYYDRLIKLPKTDLELEKLLGINVKQNIQDGSAVRAGFISPGISKFNRMIERHSTRYGNYWKSYDFASPAGNPNKNLSISPLGPQSLFGQGFEQDGGELIFSLPNGMQGYMLINGKGKKIDFAPSNIVKGGLPVHRPSNVKWIEPKGSLILPENVEEHAIVNGASCMVCHDQGMKIRPDEISLFFNDKKNLSNGGRTLSLQAIQSQYDSVSYEKLIKQDRDLFLGALKKSGVVNEPMGQVISNYVRDLDRKRIVAELRLSTGDLEEISRNSRLEKVQSILRQSQLGIKRSEFELLYPQLMKLILVELRNLPVPQDVQRQGLLSNEGFVVDTQSSVIEKTLPVEDAVKPKEIPAKLEDKQKALAAEKELEKKKLEKARLEEQARREKEQKEKIQKEKAHIEKAQQEKTQLEKQKREKQELEKQKLEKQKLEKQKEAAKAEHKQQPEPKKQTEVKQEKAKGNPAVLALCGRFDNPGRKSACESRAASGAYQANAVQYCGKLIQADLVLRCLDRIRNRKISADQFNECPKVGGAGSITDTRLSDTEMRKRNEYASECL